MRQLIRHQRACCKTVRGASPKGRCPSWTTTVGKKGRFKRCGMLSIGLTIVAACGESSGALLDLSSYRPPVEGIGGHATFGRICPSPYIVPVASDSPVLAIAASVDFHSRFGVLVTDLLENRVFLFGWDGQLRSSYGRAGSGPGEFRHLVDAVFLPDGSVVALDGSRGISRFDVDGRVSDTPTTSVLGGTSLSVLDSGLLMVSVTSPAISSRVGSASRVVMLKQRSGQRIREFGPEEPDLALRYRTIRRTVSAASLGIGLVAIGNQYEFRIEFYGIDGSGPKRTWVADGLGFLPREQSPARLRSPGEFFQWATSGSHLLSLGFLGDSTLLASWDRSEVPSKRRLFVTQYSERGGRVLFSGEVPYRLARVHGMQVAFLDARSPPSYRVLLCDWSPKRP
jgi:hypothetical protein